MDERLLAYYNSELRYVRRDGRASSPANSLRSPDGWPWIVMRRTFVRTRTSSDCLRVLRSWPLASI